MARRALVTALLLALMAAFGFGVNRILAAKRSSVTAHASVAAKPTESRPVFLLPGVLFLAEHGDIYRLAGGRFTDLDLPSNGTWMQPAIIPGSTDILAVLRTAAYSDVYRVSASGSVVRQLSHNATTGRIQLNHWMFWPRVAVDGSTVYVSYDEPKTSASYRVDFAIWQGSLGGRLATRQQTVPFDYTGGDVSPLPLANGDILYSKYEVSGINVFSRLALQTHALFQPVYLTAQSTDCSNPALSPDGTQVAMVCAGGTGLQNTRLEIATLHGATLSPPRVLVDNCLCAAPTWAPDGSGLVYYAPADSTGHFQLWWLAGAATPAPKTPRLVTTDLDFDALSPPAWAGSP
jgi:hypothetical protein